MDAQARWGDIFVCFLLKNRPEAALLPAGWDIQEWGCLADYWFRGMNLPGVLPVSSLFR